MCMALPPTEVTGPEPRRERAAESDRTKRYTQLDFVDMGALGRVMERQLCCLLLLLEEHQVESFQRHTLTNHLEYQTNQIP